MPKARRGRPRRADAKRRATTRGGRAPPPDLGTHEIRRLRRILNPGQPGLPADPLSALFARQLITEGQYRSGRHFSALTAIARGGWNLADGSVAHLYRRMVAGILGGEAVPPPTLVPANGRDTSAADHARQTLARMRAELCRPGEDATILSMTVRVCVDGEWVPWLRRFLALGTGNGNGNRPGDFRALGDLREGLTRLSELRTSRRRDISPDRAEAAE